MISSLHLLLSPSAYLFTFAGTFDFFVFVLSLQLSGGVAVEAKQDF